jgi:hypothetical protein
MLENARVDASPKAHQLLVSFVSRATQEMLCSHLQKDAGQFAPVHYWLHDLELERVPPVSAAYSLQKPSISVLAGDHHENLEEGVWCQMVCNVL